MKLKSKDIVAILLAFTVCVVLIISSIGTVFLGKENPTITELIAFLLGSIVTIIGEYVLLQLKFKKDEEDG